MNCCLCTEIQSHNPQDLPPSAAGLIAPMFCLLTLILTGEVGTYMGLFVLKGSCMSRYDYVMYYRIYGVHILLV